MLLLFLCLPVLAAQQPNLVVISLSQVGWADLNLPLWAADTPHLHALATNATSLDSLYCETSPTASHAAFLSGSQPVSWGLYSSNSAESTELKEDSGFVLPVPTLASHLPNHTSHYVGRWRLGQRPEAGPTRHGFDGFYGYVSDRSAKYDGLRYPNPGLYRDADILSRLYDTANPALDLIQGGRSNLTELLAEEAIRFVKSNTQSFYLHLSLDGTQHPAYRSPPFEGTSPRGTNFSDALREVDGVVGRVLEAVRQTETVVVVFSDSTALASHFDGGSNAPYTGEAGDSTEGGVRVPGMILSPGGQLARSGQVMNLEDLHATTLSLVAGESCSGCTGVDLSSALSTGEEVDRRVAVFRGRTLMALRWGRYKAHVNTLSNYVPGQFLDTLTSYSFKSTGTYPLLFDVLSDPGERFHVGSGIGPVPARYRDVMGSIVDEILALYGDLNMSGGLLNECDVAWREWAPPGCGTAALCLGVSEGELRMCVTPTYSWTG